MNREKLEKTTRVIALLLAVFNFSLVVTGSVSVHALTPEDRQNLSTPFYSEIIEASCSSSGQGGPANINVDRGFSLGSEAMERRVNLVQALMNDYGLTAEQASGIVGNFMEESGGKHLPPDVNEGVISGPPRFRGGYGWAQWTGGRQRTFIDFAVEAGYMSSSSVSATDAANYAYLKKELAEGYTSTIEEIKQTSSPEDAAVSFEGTFERAGIPRMERRTASARQVFDEYQASSGGVGGDGSSEGGSVNSCGGGGNAAIVDGAAFPLLTNKSGINNPGMFNNNDSDKGGHPYTAYDILVDPGVPVVAFLGGTVVRVTEDRCPGRMISIYNSESDLTISYLHLAFNNHINEGDTVEVGGHVGVVGPASAGCGTPHLHIDATTGDSRPGCSRLRCPPANSSRFVSIGPQLYQAFQQLPD